jgi:hypothetical protein
MILATCSRYESNRLHSWPTYRSCIGSAVSRNSTILLHSAPPGRNCSGTVFWERGLSAMAETRACSAKMYAIEFTEGLRSCLG